MIVHFYPWTLDIDVEATKQFYIIKNDSLDAVVNERFVSTLTESQKEFFASIGVDPMKIKLEEEIYDIPGNEEQPGKQVYRMLVNFRMCGKFLAIPEFQKKMYEGLYSDDDAAIASTGFPDWLEIVVGPEGSGLPVYDAVGLGKGIVFKLPGTCLEMDVSSIWNCGYILGTILVMSDL